MENSNNVTVFIVLGLCQSKHIEIVCFVLLSFCYIAFWMGNLLIMISVSCSQLTDQPTYFFLNYLSLFNYCYPSLVMPKIMTDLVAERNTISYNNWMAQLFSTLFFGGIEIFIPTGKAYVSYVTICKPLHYTVIMSRQRYHTIIIACYAGGFIHAANQFLLTIFLPFYGLNEIEHYSCDQYPLMKLACTDPYRIGLLVIAISDIVALVTFVVLMLSYFLILYTIRAYPAQSCSKVLSTCSSHITVVILFFVPVCFVYIRPPITFPEDKMFAVFYTIIAPMFSPLIYTLRNLEMKDALQNGWCFQCFQKGQSSYKGHFCVSP